MRLILNIARAELRYFFFSPIAWFVLIMFLMLSCGIVLGNLADYAVTQDATNELQSGKFEGFINTPLTVQIIGKGLDTVIMIFFLFIPLLTMGVINREYSAGTIKLLHSSPVTTRQIVIGKFLGVYAFVSMMILLFALVLLLLTFSILHVEFPHLVAMLLGFLFEAATYVAIGMFISSLTSYAIVAAIGSFVALGFMGALGTFLQGYDYIRDITYFLSVGGRAKRMLSGLITTRDVIYFICIISLFIAFTIIKTRSVTESKSWRVPAGRYLATLAVTIVILLATSIHGWIGYWDVTRRQTNTLHENTIQVLKQLDGSPVKVTLYTNLLGQNLIYGLPTARNAYLWNFWSKYLRFYNNIKFDYVYYYDVRKGDSSIYRTYPGKSLEQIAEKYAEMYKTDLSLFKNPAQIRKLINLEDEDKSLIMQVEYKGRKTMLRTYVDPDVFPYEMHVSASLKRLMKDTTPTFKFLAGHYERSPLKMGEREYGMHSSFRGSRASLINQGLNVDTIHTNNYSSFRKEDVLVIADPKTVFDAATIDSVKEYINRGGNAMFYTEPGKQFILNPVLNHMGVNSDEGTIVRINAHDMPHKFFGIISEKGTDIADEFSFFLHKNKVKDTCYSFIIGASQLSYNAGNEFTATPITTLYSNAETWIERGTLVVDSAAPVFNAQEGDTRANAPYVTGLQLTRKINNKEQRIIICSDADMMSAARRNGGDYGNAFYSYTVNNEFPVYHNLKVPIDIFLTVSKGTAKLFKTSFQYILPLLVLITGIIVLVRRKRK